MGTLVRPFHEEGMARYRATGEGRVIGQRMRLAAMRRDGSQFPIELAVVDVALEGSTGFAAYIHDVTAEADIEEALVRSGQRFAEKGRALQRSLLPSSIDPIDGLDLAVRYTPAGHDADVGGDFYDVFPVAEGGGPWRGGRTGQGSRGRRRDVARPDDTPRDRDAAPSLRTAFSELNDILSAQKPAKLCTLAYGRLVASDAGFRLTFGLAGHPAPLHASAAGARTIGRPGRVLGVAMTPKISETTVDLAPGDVLLLYTDGLTEARSPGGKFLGEQPVREALAAWRHLDAASIATNLEQLALSFQNQDTRDDIALVVLKVPNGSS